MYAAIAIRPNCLFSHSKYLDSSLLVFSLLYYWINTILRMQFKTIIINITYKKPGTPRKSLKQPTPIFGKSLIHTLFKTSAVVIFLPKI